MRVLIFSLRYFPNLVGGAEVAVKEITDRISQNEIVFDVVILGKPSVPEKIGNVNVYGVGVANRQSETDGSIFIFSKLAYIWFAFRKATELQKKYRYDLVWSIMASYAGFAAWLFKLRNKKLPFALTIQEGDNFEKKQGVLKKIFALIFKKADAIQVISNFLKDWSIEMGAKCKIVVIPNGVDTTLFSNKLSEAELLNLKQKLNKKDNDVFLITTSRLVPKNAVADIISALVYLPSFVKLLILGTGHLEPKLKALCKELKLEERVNFLGYVPYEELPKYLHVSDIFIRPSLSEGFGNSFIEAMAAGVPVIGTRVGGIVDFLKDGETGLFCEPNNPALIAQKIEKLLKDGESRDYIIRNAMAEVKKYEWDHIAEKMKNFLIETSVK